MTKKIPTRERIVQTAIALFNDEGIDAVAAYRIAAELGISPGNLTYYFSTKAEIVREIVGRLEERMIAAVEDFRDPTNADEISALLINVFRIMRHYRFVFESDHAIAGLDAAIERKYRELESHLHDTMVAVIGKVIEDGLMKPVRAPNSTELIVDNLWAAWLYCINSPKLSALRGREADNAAVYLCALHHFSLLEPYFSGKFAQAMHDNIQALRPAGLTGYGEPRGAEIPA
jgi:AcrR family transcriptional regulator